MLVPQPGKEPALPAMRVWSLNHWAAEEVPNTHVFTPLLSSLRQCSVGDPGSIPDPCVGKIPWRRKWQPTPVFLPGESYGWRSLAGYSLWGHKEFDTTE